MQSQEVAPAGTKIRKEIWGWGRGAVLGTSPEAEEGRVSWLLGSSSLQSPLVPRFSQIPPKPK